MKPRPPFSQEASSRSVGEATTRSGTTRTFPCDSCGADLVFAIDSQRLECPYCGAARELTPAPDAVSENDFAAGLAQRARVPDTEVGLDHEFECDSCGAVIAFEGTLSSRRCAFCGTPIQQEAECPSESRLPVDAVLPFRVSHDDARAALRRWARSRWFAPSDFQKQGVRGELSGIYLPYWTYDGLTHSRYRGERGEHYWVTVGSGKNQRRERRTRWYPASGEFRRFFDDVLVLASRSLSHEIALALEPWPLHACLPANQEVVAGFLAEHAQVDLEAGFRSAEKRMEDAITQEVRERIGGDTQRIHQVEVTHLAIQYKSVLLPTWLMGYRYRDRLYQVAVNAGTGEVQGQRPYSWLKILLLIIAVASLALATYYGYTRSQGP